MLSLIIYTTGVITGLGAILYIANKATETKEFKNLIERI